MKTELLDFSYPDNLVATEPQRPSRVMLSEPDRPPQEISLSSVLELVGTEDVVVLNDTKVVKKRLFTNDEVEVLFLDEVAPFEWTVLFPAKKFKVGDRLAFAEGLEAELIEKGLPQKIRVNRSLDFSYFEKHGHLALPPYIQKARNQRESRPEDDQWYQTEWAKNFGSAASPTASLHFSESDWDILRKREVNVLTLTLHVGLGTFLPVHAEELKDHKMHAEWVQIPHETLRQIEQAKQKGGRVWALGTTVTRALESWPRGHFQPTASGLEGMTDIFILPGFEYKVVDVLMTNFHQPKSTLLALVVAFAGFERTFEVYRWAIENKFRLFSYGDLSVWKKQ